MLTHENITNDVLSVTNTIKLRSGEDLYLAHLPLAHIYEFVTENYACLVFGAPLGFSTPYTLTDRSPNIKRGAQGDASVLQPTMMVTVPLVLERIYKSIQETIESGSPLKKAIFNLAVEYKIRRTERGLDTPIINE